jgi:microcystin-dependent protein
LASPFIGEVRIFAGSFAPQGWFLCNGQLVPIAQYTTLFGVIGTRYGGDGVTTFALPDLRGRVPIHAGQGPGLSNYPLAQQGGSEGHALTTSEIPAHTHTVAASAAVGTSDGPAGRTFARSLSATPEYAAGADTTMAAAAAAASGGGSAHNNMAPYLGLTFIIAYAGLTPPHP